MTSPTSAPPTSNSNAFNSPDRPRKRTRPTPQSRLAARLYTRPGLGVCQTSRDPVQTDSLRTHAAANHSKRTGRRSVHAGPPAPDLFFSRHDYRLPFPAPVWLLYSRLAAISLGYEQPKKR